MAKLDTDGQATHEGEDVVISIKVEDPNPRLTTSIRQMMRESSPLSLECCIYRAPKRLRQLNEKVFEPLLVSIGPFHHRKENLQAIERLKVAYLEAFLTHGNVSLETCIKMVMEWENRVRNCHAEPIYFSGDDFVKMILLDSCFIIEVIWRFNYENIIEEVIDHLNHPRVVTDVLEDLILLENQVPFFVLQGFFNRAFSNSQGTTDHCEPFVNLCTIYVGGNLSLSQDDELVLENISRQLPVDVKHLLDLLRICQAPSIPRRNPQDAIQSSMWNPNKLEEAGMVIKPSSNYSSATDIL